MMAFGTFGTYGTRRAKFVFLIPTYLPIFDRKKGTFSEKINLNMRVTKGAKVPKVGED